MTVAFEYPQRVPAMPMAPQPQALTLEDRFEVMKDIGDGSFGSVTLARVRTAGAHVAKRGTMVAIKTMKKTFDSFGPCLELREVIFLRTLPIHVHLVPALDIFLDPTTKRLHICMEHMDGNLYQLMKARDHRYLDGASVKSILFQILGGLDHIHTHHFFHRDIKPENILLSTSAPPDASHSFRRYSALVTPPATPPAYSVKIADFGLARETYSKAPYTTYVSTRWYRAPEVLLRAGEYSAPVDIWALGAMAVEIATLKPLFPGGNEVDQVWRVCEIMGSPGNWYNKSGAKVGGGDWREGIHLAKKLGFSFPKMAPHSLETILPAPQWPKQLAEFVTWCLMWDPKHRPTSLQAMHHDFFADAVDPLTRPKSSSRLLSRKHSTYDAKAKAESDAPARTSWFRKSLVARESAPAVPQQQANPQLISPGPSPVHPQQPVQPELPQPKAQRPNAAKRATWAPGQTHTTAPQLAPMPILPSIRPISPLSNAVTAQAQQPTQASQPLPPSHHQPYPPVPAAAEHTKAKIGRQLSLASHGNHYGDLNAERVLSGLRSPTSPSKEREGFFSHLRKRARRLSGRNQLAVQSPKYDEAATPNLAAAVQSPAVPSPLLSSNEWPTSNRSSMLVDPPEMQPKEHNFTDLDAALHQVRYGTEQQQQQQQLLLQQQRTPNSTQPTPTYTQQFVADPAHALPPALLKRSASGRHDEVQPPQQLPISSRTRRALHVSAHPAHRYETPDEEEELLDEALSGARRAARGLAQTRPVKYSPSTSLHHSLSVGSMRTSRVGSVEPSATALLNPYPTPSPSQKRSGGIYASGLLAKPTTPVAMPQPRKDSYPVSNMMWPTPPYDENEWAASASASIFAAGGMYR